ncbi:MAG TPA: sigma-54 dependent transcriptional regulator [Vicinamibacterales bacterium]|nr:sigma-54 dependent transcriptional regulator [Vicinamibacterales bacterium]
MEIIADRFLWLGANRARDLATGLTMGLTLVSERDARGSTEREVDEAALVDEGPCGPRTRFEARLAPHEIWPAEWRSQAGRAADAVLRAAPAGDAVGVHAIGLPWVAPRARLSAMSAIARVFRARGYVTVGGDVLGLPGLFEAVRQRHQVILLTDSSELDRVSAWLLKLAAVSPRAHLVADLRPGRDRPADADAGRALARTDQTVIWLRRGTTPDSGARGSRDAAGAETGVQMASLAIVTRLIQLVNEADDDLVLLTGLCRTVRGQPGCLGCAIVSAAEGRLVTGDGIAAPDLLANDVASAIDGRPGRVVALGGRAVVAGHVRHASVHIGTVVATATPDGIETTRELVQLVASLSASALRTRLDAVALARAGADRMPEILGTSPGMVAVREAIARSAQTTFPVLIEGGSGTGKELVARAIHRLSPRRDRGCCAVNCAAITDELVEAELFGHARGAFTGAIGPRAGLFEEANGGTLFLDEVAELSPRAQAKLLRVLQEREVRRLGENTPRRVDVRIVAATNLPLAEAAASGRFREDLLFRLAVARIRMPALADRLEDLPLLAAAFWRRAAQEAGTRAVVGADAIAALCRHTWPGNVRELQNVMAALALAAPSRGRVTPRQVALAIGAAAPASDAPPQPLGRAVHHFERRAIAAALARHGGRRAPAARELGITRQGLAKAMRRVGLAMPTGRAGVA